MSSNRSKYFLLAFGIALLLQACDKNDPAPAESGNEYINSWIHDKMDFWYYWTSGMPDDPDKSQEPEDFFESLLSPDDRFSWIQKDYTELLNSLRGVSKEAGFEFALYRESQDNTNVIMQVLYTKPSSPAAVGGLKRGDVINKINDTQITTDNYRDVVAKLSENHSLTFKPVDYEAKTLGASQTINVIPVEYAENPNYLNKVYTYGDRKVGYYVYNLFSEGPDGNSKPYTTEMDNIIASFKAQGITDLVIDLRFNSGGAESAAQHLASLIAKGVNTSTVFVKHEYNEQVTAAIKSDPNLGEGFLSVPFLNKSQNVGGQLRDSRVYILTGSRTASASELIINGLRPFMDVYLVGGTTVGKNVGSISIYEESDPENTYGIQPIVTKLLNSQGQSDYSNGFTAQAADADNSLILYPLGDPRETLLNKALQVITGSSAISRTADSPKAGNLLMHSLDLEKRSGIVTIKNPLN
jgi:C-terminal processing protease CtpA/Prc